MYVSGTFSLILFFFCFVTLTCGTQIRLENNVSFNKKEILARIGYEDKTALKRKNKELVMKSLWFKPHKGSRLGIWRNVAHTRRVTVSSHTRRGQPQHATDGNHRTYTMTHYRHDSWIAVSLEKTYHIGFITLFYLKPFIRLIRGFTVFTHHPSTGWHQCGLSRNSYFSTEGRYIIVDCPPNTYGDYVLIIKKGRGALGFREIHVQAWVDSTPQEREEKAIKVKGEC